MSEVEKGSSNGQDLVIVSALAAGIEALSTLVSTLPSSFPAPVLVVTRLDHSYSSSLHLILQQQTHHPVELVSSRSKLRAGTIYLVPPDRHITMKDHYVEVYEGQTQRSKPSIDSVFSTAAEAYKECLIAIILSGTGADSAVGVIDVKNAGGTVIVQDPLYTRYPTLPLALPPTIVDFEVAVEQIGPLLHDLLNDVEVPHTEEKTEDVLREILEQVSRQASLDFRSYKTSTILRRIGRRMVVTHCRTMRLYSDYLKAYPEEIGELVRAFLINVTQFFRDTEAFAYIKSEILPRLIDRAREQDRVLRFWTAGCSTGEESYSLAMLLTDLLGAELPEWSIKIFATDLDEAAINFARRGLYSEILLKGMPTEYRNRFFERVEQGYHIAKTLRQMVIFGQQNLSRSAPFPRIDLVFCRNVLIYFTPDLQDYVLNQFTFSLCPDGYLFLGKAETIRPVKSFYELVSKHWKIYRCTGNPLPSIRRQTLSGMNTTQIEGGPINYSHRNISKQNADQKTSVSSLELGQLRRFNDLLLRFLPVGIVVVDNTYCILTSNGAARRLLGLSDMPNEQDFLHTVRGIPYQITRSAIDDAFRERTTVLLPEVELDRTSGGNGHFVSFSIALIHAEDGAPELAVISVTEVTEQVQIRRQLEIVQLQQSQLMHELSATNKRLNDANKELMDANEELQVNNEELMLTHEELQASIEEFETTNEELQATNEELETNNEELQATNEELETNNEELQARTTEMQELTSLLEREHIRLSEIVELAPFYILVLHGPALVVEAFSPGYVHFLEETVVQGRPLEEVNTIFWEEKVGASVMHLAHDVYQQNEVRILQRVLTHLPEAFISSAPEQEQIQQKLANRYFTYTIVPSHDTNGWVDGVIVYAVDETERQLLETAGEFKQLVSIPENSQ